MRRLAAIIVVVVVVVLFTVSIRLTDHHTRSIACDAARSSDLALLDALDDIAQSSPNIRDEVDQLRAALDRAAEDCH